jgi:serine O-acetyltransferase
MKKELMEWVNRDIADVAEKMGKKQQRTCAACLMEGQVNLSTRAAIYEALDNLIEALFPGCYHHESVDQDDLLLFVTERLRKAAILLAPQVEFAFRHKCDIKKCGNCDCEDMASQSVMDLIKQMTSIHETLLHDIQAAYDGDPAAVSFNEIVLAYPCVEAIATHRIAHVLYQHGVPIIPRIMSERAHANTGIDIHPGATIGKRFFIDHGTGVVIGETSNIGVNVKIYQGVTLGALSFPLDGSGIPIKGIKRHPNIEDDVTIYSGATILGGETTVGKGSIIGGNVWLITSVPPDSRIYNDPSKPNGIHVKTKSEKPAKPAKPAKLVKAVKKSK